MSNRKALDASDDKQPDAVPIQQAADIATKRAIDIAFANITAVRQRFGVSDDLGLTDEDFEALQEALKNPPKPTEKLKELMHPEREENAPFEGVPGNYLPGGMLVVTRDGIPVPDQKQGVRDIIEAARAAQGTEAQRAETPQSGSVHDGPVGNADAPKPNRNLSGDGR